MFKDLFFKSKLSTQKQTTKQESGRSMVEMLGVLTIMGLLSIGAIAGYRHAMDQYKANETINELTLRAVSVGEQVRQNKGTLTMDEFPVITRQGYPVTAFREPDDPKLFELEVTHVPVGVCRKILKMGWKLPVLMKANEIVYGGNDLICEPSEMDNRETATMVFLFDEDLDETALPNWYCEEDSDCNACQRCQENICVSSCEGYERCAQDTETGEQICCPKERRSGPYCCAKAVNGMCCNENDQCCPWHKPLIGKDGNCYSCDNEAGVDVTGVEENCGVCTNRELWERTSFNIQCVIPCQKDAPLRQDNGKCYSCDYPDPIVISHTTDYCETICPNRVANGWLNRYCSFPCGEGTFTGGDGKCYSCDEEKSVGVDSVSHDGCDQCDNRTQVGNYCVLDCPKEEIKGDDGICYPCDHSDPITIYNALNYCSNICPNRVVNGWHDRLCSLPCGEEERFTGADGKCYSCDETKPINMDGVSHDGCELCPNRTLSGNYCILNCPTKEIRGSDGKCYSCDHSDPITIYNALNYCSNICPNRIANGYHNQRCSIPCKEGTFTGATGKCYSCDEEKNIDVNSVFHEGCERCPNTRNLYNLMCVPKCSGDSPLRGSDNKCYPCDTETRIPVTNMTDACYECADQRKLDGSHCVLK